MLLRVRYHKKLAESVISMEKGDIITLSNGKKATILNADTTRYKNIIIAETQAQEILVVDRETLSPTRPKRANMF